MFERVRGGGLTRARKGTVTVTKIHEITSSETATELLISHGNNGYRKFNVCNSLSCHFHCPNEEEKTSVEWDARGHVGSGGGQFGGHQQWSNCIISEAPPLLVKLISSLCHRQTVNSPKRCPSLLTGDWPPLADSSFSLPLSSVPVSGCDTEQRLKARHTLFLLSFNYLESL